MYVIIWLFWFRMDNSNLCWFPKRLIDKRLHFDPKRLNTLPFAKNMSHLVLRHLRLISRRSRIPPMKLTIQCRPALSRLLQTRYCSNNPTEPVGSAPTEPGFAKIDYSRIYKDRTGITSGLWRLRLSLVDHDAIDPCNPPPTRSPLIARPPWQSSILVLYDFVCNESTLSEYIRFDGGVRFERILEDMDSLAGNVAEAHASNDDGYPLSFVTAAVDRIDLKRRFPLNINLVMQGIPIYVGKSSINIQLSVHAKDDANFVICTANFIMVAKDGMTGKPIEINPLSLDDEVAQQNFMRGKFDNELRKEERDKRLTVLKPSSLESDIIHQIWLDTHVRRNIDMSDTHSYVAINDTKHESTVICQPQHLNRNGKIFGGYLMKCAYELARVTAYKFIGGLQNIYDEGIDKAEIITQHPQFVSSDEITFVHPVSVGCIIRNESVVACTDTMNVMRTADDRKAMMIFVKTYIQIPGKEEEILSNLFMFCYVVPNPKKAMKRVVPLTYEESMIYLQGKRALDETTKIAIRNGSAFAQYL
eukprot:94184_1